MTRAIPRADHSSDRLATGNHHIPARPPWLLRGKGKSDLLKACRAGHVNIGAISGPAVSFVPRAIARVAEEYPLVRLRLQVESSEYLLNALQAGRIDVMVGRLLEHHDLSNFNYTRLTNEPMCAVARKGHPLLKQKQVHMRDLAASPWIVPQVGSILRQRFDLMFREAGCSSPSQIIEAVSQMVVTRLIEETNYLALLARDAAEYYASFGTLSIVPVTLSCDLESFGIVTRKDALLSPASQALCDALEAVVAKTSKPAKKYRRPINA